MRAPRFEEIFQSGKRESGRWVRLLTLPGTGEVGIATSRQIGCHARRNRIKRRYRELCRALGLSCHLDYVLIANRNAPDASFEELREDLRSLLNSMLLRWEKESVSR